MSVPFLDLNSNSESVNHQLVYKHRVLRFGRFVPFSFFSLLFQRRRGGRFRNIFTVDTACVYNRSRTRFQNAGNCPEIDGLTMSVPMAPEATLSGHREVFNNYEGSPSRRSPLRRQSKTQLREQDRDINGVTACTVKPGNLIKINYHVVFHAVGFHSKPVIKSLMDRSAKSQHTLTIACNYLRFDLHSRYF